jgi:hypothetical protein
MRLDKRAERGLSDRSVVNKIPLITASVIYFIGLFLVIKDYLSGYIENELIINYSKFL